MWLSGPAAQQLDGGERLGHRGRPRTFGEAGRLQSPFLDDYARTPPPS
jgi:hypothetical protein